MEEKNILNFKLISKHENHHWWFYIAQGQKKKDGVKAH
jgi:hypothetical protein